MAADDESDAAGEPSAVSVAGPEAEADDGRPEGFRRVRAALAALGHPHVPVWLDVAARTSQEAADALGVTVAQIAKSVVFRRVVAGGGQPEVAVLVVTSGDKRVDEKRVAALVCGESGRLARADAEFVKARTGFSIGGVAPLAHSEPPVLLIDRELFRFEEIWAAAGHPNGVFRLAPADLPRLTGGAPVADVVQQVP
ncbi:MAG: YbaK/EbsC family protein [Rubrivivax sp.]|nr:YbaK/EbsC family protein [Rubrivivax sp.]